MGEEAKDKKITIKEWAEANPKKVFAFRFFFWTAFACILPMSFIAWRYEIFTSASKINLTGYGFIAIIIAIVFIIALLRYLYKCLEPGLFKQCVIGFVKITLPLTIFLILVMNIEKNITIFRQAMSCVIVCETIAIPFNPFPSLVEKNKKLNFESKAETISDLVLEKAFNWYDKRGNNK